MIIRNTAEVRQFLPANINLSIEGLKPFIEPVEQKYLVKVLGQEQYDIINEYASSTTADENKDKLIKQCIPPVVFLSVLEGFDLLNVELSDVGFRRSESEAKKSLYGYQERNIKAFLKNAGFNGLETLLKFLEDNIETYTVWADSDECTNAYDSLIRNATEFTKFWVQLKGSAIVFKQLKSAMQRAEDFQIRAVVGNTLIDTVKELIKDREIDNAENAKYKLLLPYIQKPLAYFTIHEGAEELGAKLTDKGLYFEQVDAGLIPDNISETSPADKVAIIKEQAYNNGKRYIATLTDYLKAHSTDFATEYTPISTVIEVADQTNKKTFTAY